MSRKTNSKPKKKSHSDKKQNSKRGKKGKKPTRRDLFEDLRDLETHEIEDMINDNKASSRSIESELKSLESERASLITTSQFLTTALHGPMNKERSELFAELRGQEFQEIEQLEGHRDRINERVAPPSKLIEKLIERTWRQLSTIPEDPSKSPDLRNEIQKFSFFFELKEMYKLKKQSDGYHAQYVGLRRKQRGIYKKLDELRDKSAEIAKKEAGENPRLADTKISIKEKKKLDGRIEKMLGAIRRQRSELHRVKREVGRLESFSRIRKGDEKRGRKVRKRINTLREHAMSGGTLSMEDMARILEAGGLSQLQESDNPKTSKKKKKKLSSRRGGRSKTQPRRGVARSHQRREE